MQRSPSSPATRRRRAERRGRWGEMLAALYLQLKLYRVLERRVKTPVGEIDLIARKADTLVFVEVKARDGAEAEAEAHAAVNRTRIARAAHWYMMRHPSVSGLTMRFDLIFVAGFSRPRHIPNAFEDKT